MKKKLFLPFKFLLFLGVVYSCDSGNHEFMKYENGILKIDKTKLEASGTKLKDIQIVENLTVNQGVSLDSSYRINTIYSLKKKNKFSNGNNWNNWLSINYDGNLDIENSYFYEEVIYEQNDSLFAEINFQTSKYKNGLTYILYGNIDKNFSALGKLDTVFFKDGLATFPVLNTNKGRNEKRFILIDESQKDKKGKKKQRFLFGTLRFDK